MPFGRNPFARRFGGGTNVLDIEHMAMLDALAPGWDISDDTAIYAETYAHALAVTMIWRINGRLKNALNPLKMMENLPVWEEATGLRPKSTDSAPARRRALAAKMRGFIGNTINDIFDVCSTAAGTNFLGLSFVDPPTTYFPGINPGPPGYEWSSNRATIGVRLQATGLTETAFGELAQFIHQQLDILLPGWMTFFQGTDETGSFIAGVGIAGRTLL